MGRGRERQSRIDRERRWEERERESGESVADNLYSATMVVMSARGVITTVEDGLLGRSFIRLSRSGADTRSHVNNYPISESLHHPHKT